MSTASEELDHEGARRRARLDAWLAPVSPEAPAGVNARSDPLFERLAQEVSKLDAPAGGEVDWSLVRERSEAVLRERSKDILAGAYLAQALLMLEGHEGLLTGLALLAELLERYWDTAFPELRRPRGRANALGWFIERAANALSSRTLAADDAAVQSLTQAARRLGELSAAKLGELSPVFSPLSEALGKLERQASRSSDAQPQATTQSSSASQSTPQATQQSTVGTSGGAAVAGLSDPSGADAYLKSTGASMMAAAGLLRRAGAQDPHAYRLLRAGLWLQLSTEPPAAGGRTAIAPPPEPLRQKLSLLFQNQKWEALIEESESALTTHRLWLDPHRLTAQALGALFGAAAPGRRGLLGELKSLLTRMPMLAGASFSDGTPVADGVTRGWLAEEVQGTPGGPGSKETSPGSEERADALDALAEVRRLLAAGQKEAALAAMRERLRESPGGRGRFVLRLEFAHACATSGLVAVAKATYDELDRDAAAHGLEGWEPGLVVQYLKGLVTTTRALKQDPRGTQEQLVSRYQRLCRLDPAAAHEVWP